jgi:hypothetical protein
MFALQMYVPTMLVIGLHGWFLHPIAILICDMVVYAEFSIHPIVLVTMLLTFKAPCTGANPVNVEDSLS